MTSAVIRYPLCYNTGCPENCIYHHRVGNCPFNRGEKEAELAYRERQKERWKRERELRRVKA